MAHPQLSASEASRLLTHLMTLARPDPVPLARWADEIRATYAARERPTRLRMGQAVRECCEVAGQGSTTADLTPELVARFLAAQLAKDPAKAPATVNGLLRALRAACNLAVARGWLAAGPFSGFSGWQEEDPDARRHHGRAAIAGVLAHLGTRSDTWDGRRLHALAAVLAYCGLRLKEALRLRVEEIDLESGFLHVKRTRGRRLKTARSAAPVPMPDALMAILRLWIPRCGSEWAFPGAQGRGPWVGGSVGRRATDRLKAAAREVGIEGFTPASLRRSLATHLVAYSGKPRLVMQVLRHARVTTEDHYIKADRDNLRAAVRGFDFAPTPPVRADRAHVLPRKRLGRRPPLPSRRSASV